MKPADPSFDLPRLDASQPLLSDAVATLRANGPDATELASLASRLALAGVDVSLPAPASARPKLRLKKWLAGGGAASGALIWLALSLKPPAPHAAAVTSPSRARAVEARISSPSWVINAAPPSKAVAAVDAPSAAPTPPELAEPTPSEPHDDVQAPLVAGDATTRPSPAVPTPAAPPATPLASTPAHAISNGTPRGDATGSPLDAPQLRDTPTEIELLRDARLALKQAPARALTLVEQHARAYPGGKLTQERELLAISALAALGRRTAALSRGARFEHDFPNSPYRDQVEQLLR